jgi:hypothetical protein
MRLRSHPAWHRSCGCPHPLEGTSTLTRAHPLIMLSGTPGHLLPRPVSRSHRQFSWDKAVGLLRPKPGLLHRLPLAPDELHYEHRAPQNRPSGRKVWGTAPECVKRGWRPSSQNRDDDAGEVGASVLNSFLLCGCPTLYSVCTHLSRCIFPSSFIRCEAPLMTCRRKPLFLARDGSCKQRDAFA